MRAEASEFVVNWRRIEGVSEFVVNWNYGCVNNGGSRSSRRVGRARGRESASASSVDRGFLLLIWGITFISGVKLSIYKH